MPARAFMHLFPVVAVLILATPSICAAAEPQLSAGSFNSPKGFGLCLETGCLTTGSALTRYTVYADIYGLPRGRIAAPGLKANFSLCRALKKYDDLDGISAVLYAGPGVSAGWVHDIERSVAGKEHLVNNPGLAAALSGVAGVRLTFSGRPWVLDISFLGEAGFLIRQDEFMDNKDLTLYKAGIHQVVYPQINIIRRFR